MRNRRSSGILLCKALLGAVLMAGFFWLLLIGTLESEGNKEKTASKTDDNNFTATFSTMQVLGRDKFVDPKFHLNYMSKRRVPKGPDPIHNRRAGNSKRPPGQS